MIPLRNVRPEDLAQLLQIESENFTKEESATKSAFIERISVTSDTFIVAERNGEILGYINGQAISIDEKTMEELDLKIGDTLNVVKRDGEIILTKKEDKSFEEEWEDFFEIGDSYADVEMAGWGKDTGREEWKPVKYKQSVVR